MFISKIIVSYCGEVGTSQTKASKQFTKLPLYGALIQTTRSKSLGCIFEEKRQLGKRTGKQ